MAKKRTKKTSKPAPKRPASTRLVAQPSWLQHGPLLRIVVVVFPILLYLNTLGNGFAQDDAIVLTDNTLAKSGIEGIPEIFTTDTFYGFFGERGKSNLVAGGRYRPLSLALLAIEYEIAGLQPMLHHLINVLLFAACCLLLYLTLHRLLSRGKQAQQGLLLALFTTLLFAAHPIHTEAVANIKGRDEIMALLGSLGALYLLLRPGNRNRILAAACFFLALLSKENAITFVAIVPLAMFFFLRVPTRQIIFSTATVLGTALLFVLVRSSVIGFQLAAPADELMNNPFLVLQGNQYVPVDASTRLATIAYTLGKYLQLLFFPYPLTHDYYPRHVELMRWTDPTVLLSVLAYAGIGVLAALGFRQKSILSFGLLYYLLTLSIVSNIVFPVGTNMAERLIFMPSVGFCLALSLLLLRGSVWLSGRRLQHFAQLHAALLMLILLLLSGSLYTVARNQVWKDNFTLFTTDVEVSRNSAKLRNAVGGELIARSEQLPSGDREQMLREAVGHLKRATAIHPRYSNAYLLLGNAYNRLKQYEASVDAYQQALRLAPGYQDAENNLIITYREAGRYYGEERGDIELAIKYLLRAWAADNQSYETARLLGVAHGIKGDSEQALNYFQAAAELRPDLADAWYNLGTAYGVLGMKEKADAYRQKAINMDPTVQERMR